MPTRNYAFGAGQIRHFGGGNEIRLVECPSEVTVKVFKNGTELVSETAEGVKAGLKLRPPRDPGQGLAFEDATVESAVAQTIKIFTTKGESSYDRSVGDVNATILQSESGQYRNSDAFIQADQAFQGGTILLASGVQFSEIQLFNPAATGKDLLLDSVTLMTDALIKGNFYLAFEALAVGISTGLVFNKDLGSAVAAVAQIRANLNAGGTSGTFLGFIGHTGFHTAVGVGPNSWRVDFSPAIQIPQGVGVDVGCDALGVDLGAYFQWRELTA